MLFGENLAPSYNFPSTSPRQISTKAGCTYLWKTWASWEKITGFSTVSFNKSNIRQRSIIHSYLIKETASSPNESSRSLRLTVS